MTTGADHFEELLRQAKIVGESLDEDRRGAAVMSFVSSSALLTAAHLQSEHEYGVAHDLVELSARFVRQVHEHEIADDPEARRFAAETVARIYGIEIPDTTPPKIAPVYGVENREAALAWAIATLRNAETPPTKSAWLGCSDICCFGGAPELCGKPIDGVVVLLEENHLSVAAYCEEHAKIMREAIDRVRSEAGALSDAELAELGIEGGAMT